ncbi:MAG TPA: NADH-quinone oxidoreductase subunit N [Burkholderiaceae bacterium]|nr:NADH-quinone oxidoreductase subunit N [Burkholderiaceae bacterium]
MNLSALLTGMLPENLLLVGIVVLLVQAIVGEHGRGAAALSIGFVGAAAACAAVLGLAGFAGTPFEGQLSVTPAASYGKAVALALALPVLLLAHDDLGDGGPLYPLMLSSLYGLTLMLGADSFLTLFLGLELMSLPVYALVLMGIARTSAAEAALKYTVLGGAATATLLMGVSLLYGHSGTLALAGFAGALGGHDAMATTGAVMVLLAFFLKGAVVPFHTWAPDAYEGAHVPVTGYMAAIVKAGVLLAALRLFGDTALAGPMVGLLALLPLVSIVWGNLAAMRQPNLRRMMAYSSIAHAGYLYLAFLGAGPGRFASVWFYLLAYGVMTVLAFALLPRHADDVQRDTLEQLKGLFHRSPYAAIAIGLAMLSLAGIPPLPGFVAKFQIFREVMAAGHTEIAVAGLVGSYLGIYFYLRVIQYMFMAPVAAAAEGSAPPRGAAIAASALCLLPAIVAAVLPGSLLTLL